MMKLGGGGGGGGGSGEERIIVILSKIRFNLRTKPGACPAISKA